MQRRIFAPLAEYFAIDIAFGAGERPAVLFGQHLRLLLERDDRHDTSPNRFLTLTRMLDERYGNLSFCLVLSAHALRSGPSLDFAL